MLRFVPERPPRRLSGSETTFRRSFSVPVSGTHFVRPFQRPSGPKTTAHSTNRTLGGTARKEVSNARYSPNGVTDIESRSQREKISNWRGRKQIRSSRQRNVFGPEEGSIPEEILDSPPSGRRQNGRTGSLTTGLRGFRSRVRNERRRLLERVTGLRDRSIRPPRRLSGGNSAGSYRVASQGGA